MDIPLSVYFLMINFLYPLAVENALQIAVCATHYLRDYSCGLVYFSEFDKMGREGLKISSIHGHDNNKIYSMKQMI